MAVDIFIYTINIRLPRPESSTQTRSFVHLGEFNLHQQALVESARHPASRLEVARLRQPRLIHARLHLLHLGADIRLEDDIRTLG